MKMKSTASRPFKYGGTLVQPQAEFSVKSARDVKVLSLMRRAEIVPDPAPVDAKAPAKRTYKRRDMTAEAAAAPAALDRPGLAAANPAPLELPGMAAEAPAQERQEPADA